LRVTIRGPSSSAAQESNSQWGEPSYLVEQTWMRRPITWLVYFAGDLLEQPRHFLGEDGVLWSR
jgi:hypothetical protein